MKKLSIVFSIVVLMFVMTACSSNSPKKVAEKSVQCLVDKDYEGYVDLIYFKESETKSAEDLEKGKQQLAAILKDKVEKEYAKKGGIKSYEAQSEKIAEDGKTANVNMKITYGNGKEEETDIKLCKDDKGEWKLDLAK